MPNSSVFVPSWSSGHALDNVSSASRDEIGSNRPCPGKRARLDAGDRQCGHRFNPHHNQQNPVHCRRWQRHVALQGRALSAAGRRCKHRPLWGRTSGPGWPRLQHAKPGKYSRHLFDDPRKGAARNISAAKLARRCVGIARTEGRQTLCRSERIADLLALVFITNTY